MQAYINRKTGVKTIEVQNYRIEQGFSNSRPSMIFYYLIEQATNRKLGFFYLAGQNNYQYIPEYGELPVKGNFTNLSAAIDAVLTAFDK